MLDNVLTLGRALLTSELEEIFRNAPKAPNAMANSSVREAYARATGKAPATDQQKEASKERKMPSEGDDCPICYEAMHKESAAKLEWCKTCGNALHKECFNQCSFHTYLLPSSTNAFT